jgi:hypothetical protein
MWVRIDEISFAADRAEDVINHVRNNAVVAHNGDTFVGFRLLVDRDNGRALNVSYWNDAAGARADRPGAMTEPAAGAETTVVRTELYELSIDAA